MSMKCSALLEHHEHEVLSIIMRNKVQSEVFTFLFINRMLLSGDNQMLFSGDMDDVTLSAKVLNYNHTT